MPQGASPILGVEFSGTVAQTGGASDKWKEGDEVLGIAAGVRVFRLVVLCIDTRNRARTRNMCRSRRLTYCPNRPGSHGSRLQASRRRG